MCVTINNHSTFTGCLRGNIRYGCSCRREVNTGAAVTERSVVLDLCSVCSVPVLRYLIRRVLFVVLTAHCQQSLLFLCVDWGKMCCCLLSNKKKSPGPSLLITVFL